MTHAWAVLYKCNHDTCMGCAMQVQPSGISTKSVSNSSLVVTVLWGGGGGGGGSYPRSRASLTHIWMFPILDETS